MGETGFCSHWERSISGLIALTMKKQFPHQGGVVERRVGALITFSLPYRLKEPAQGESDVKWTRLRKGKRGGLEARKTQIRLIPQTHAAKSSFLLLKGELMKMVYGRIEGVRVNEKAGEKREILV